MKKKTVRVLLIMVCMLLVFCMIAGCQEANVTEDDQSGLSKKEQKELEAAYIAAKELFDAGDYKTAFEQLQTLGSYKDSQELCVEAMLSFSDEFSTAIYVAQTGNMRRANEIYDFSKHIAASDNITMACKKDGQVLCDALYSYAFDDLRKITDAVSVSAWEGFGYIIRADGTTEENSPGMYGTRQYEEPNWDNVISTADSRDHKIGLLSDGTVIAVGANAYGECDVSDWRDIVAICAGDGFSIGLKSDGTVLATGNNNDNQCDVDGWKDIIAISASGYHVVGLKSDGTVVATGNNRYHQCDVQNWENIVAIAAGFTHTVGLGADGRVVAIGERDASNGWKLW